MIDLNNPDYLKKIGKAASSDDGKVIVEFLRNEYNKLRYEDIDIDLPPEQLALEFKKMREVKEFIDTRLKILKSN